MKITEIRHPEYLSLMSDWKKWRLTYNSGEDFIDTYLKQYTLRETFEDFQFREEITYVPAFAKVAVEEIRKAICTRANDIRRVGGSSTYRDALSGLIGGVDLQSSTMNSFIGEEVLTELLPMKRVGIYIDNYTEESLGATMASKQNKHPYLYIYKTEDILSWKYDNQMELESVLLRSTGYDLDPEFHLPTSITHKYRYIVKHEDYVQISEYNANGLNIGNWLINLPEIPFIIIELNKSLMEDIANYQIAMLNVASSDVNFLVKANFPFYTEQYDPKSRSTNLRSASTMNVPTTNNQPVALLNEMAIDGSMVEAAIAKDPEVKVGISQGRSYPLGTERPGFIAPPSDPIKISMEKQEAMKKEIRQLVNLSLGGVVAKMASAESKESDKEGMIYGIASIAQVLERLERRIAYFWHIYESSKNDVIINYPRQYNIQSEEERSKEAKSKKEVMVLVPSISFKKAMAKEIAQLMLGHKVSPDIMDTILSEIEEATIMNTDPEFIIKAHVEGLVSDATASETIGFPKGDVVQAGEDHAARLARIQIAQTPVESKSTQVQGVNQDTKSAQDMKKLNQDGNFNTKNTNKNKTRGDGK